jgi:hypothetical protein
VTVQKILSRFVYQADVIPRGGRATRRIDLWAPSEFEITTVAKEDIASDAVLVQPRLDRAGYAGAIPLPLAAYNGLLWSPMKPLEPRGEIRNFAHLPSLSVDAYLAQFRGEFVTAWASDDPILGAYDGRYSERAGRLPDRKTMREDHFDGRVLWSNRAEALHRHAAAARDVLFVGAHVYTRRPEPTWSVAHDNQSFNGPAGGNGGIVLTGLVTHNTLQRFRLDRHEDAMAWRDVQNPEICKTLHGAIIHADFSLLRRNDLACMISDALPAAIHGQATMALPYFSDEGLASWRALSNFVRSMSLATFVDDQIEMPSDQAEAHLSRLSHEFGNPALPRLFGRAVAEALQIVHSLLTRAKFEAKRAPSPCVADEDEIALTKLGATP